MRVSDSYMIHQSARLSECARLVKEHF